MPKRKAEPKQCEEAQIPSVAGWGTKLIDELANSIGADDVSILRLQLDALTRSPITPPLKQPATTHPIIVRSRSSLKQVASAVADAAQVVIDLETAGLDPRKGEIVGIGLAPPEATYYIPISHRSAETGKLLVSQLPLTEVLAALRLQEKRLIAHNAKYELKWLQHHGKFTCQFVWDTMLAARLLRSDLPADLEKVAVRELDVPDWSLPPDDLKRIQFLPIQTVATYCGKDCRYTLEIYRRQLKCLV